MVLSIEILPAVNGFFVEVHYTNNPVDRVFCKSTAQINALLKQLFPKPVKQVA